MKLLSLSSLFLLIVGFTASSAEANNSRGSIRLYDGTNTFEINIGSANEGNVRNLSRRVHKLERAVHDLQREVFSLRQDQRPKQEYWVCSTQDNFGRTYYSDDKHSHARGAAERSARQNCLNRTNFCQNEVTCQEG